MHAMAALNGNTKRSDRLSAHRRFCLVKAFALAARTGICTVWNKPQSRRDAGAPGGEAASAPVRIGFLLVSRSSIFTSSLDTTKRISRDAAWTLMASSCLDAFQNAGRTIVASSYLDAFPARTLTASSCLDAFRMNGWMRLGRFRDAAWTLLKR